MEADSKASMTIADMVHGEGLPGDFAQRPKVIAAMEAYKTTPASHKSPGREQVDWYVQYLLL